MHSNNLHPTGAVTRLTSSLTRGLARLLARPVDPVTRSRAAAHVLDWLGCAVIGATEPAGCRLLRHAATAPAGRCSVVGGRGAAEPGRAAFCNGGLGNILEMDDIHRVSILHPGPVVVPAALAAAEWAEASAEGFLDAVIRGYEAQIRIGSAVGPGHYAKWHNTSTCGPFGAAAAVGSVMGLDEDRMVWALGNAGTQSSGFWRCRHEPVMTKQLHTARASQAGCDAAALASMGFTGPEFVLEGEQGFFDAMCPDPAPERILADGDGPWKVWETSFKPWPACRHVHAAIDAALLIRARHAPRPEDIASIRVRTYADARRFCDCAGPTTTLEAKFSFQHSVAVVLLKGEPGLGDYGPTEITGSGNSALRGRISVEVSDAFEDRYPTHYGSGVDLRLGNGQELSADVPDALGDPENPLAEEQVAAKALCLMAAAGVPGPAASTIADAVLSLGSGTGLARFSELVAGLSSLIRQEQAS